VFPLFVTFHLLVLGRAAASPLVLSLLLLQLLDTGSDVLVLSLHAFICPSGLLNARAACAFFLALPLLLGYWVLGQMDFSRLATFIWFGNSGLFAGMGARYQVITPWAMLNRGPLCKPGEIVGSVWWYAAMPGLLPLGAAKRTLTFASSHAKDGALSRLIMLPILLLLSLVNCAAVFVVGSTLVAALGACLIMGVFYVLFCGPMLYACGALCVPSVAKRYFFRAPLNVDGEGALTAYNMSLLFNGRCAMYGLCEALPQLLLQSINASQLAALPMPPGVPALGLIGGISIGLSALHVLAALLHVSASLWRFRRSGRKNLQLEMGVSEEEPNRPGKGRFAAFVNDLHGSIECWDRVHLGDAEACILLPAVGARQLDLRRQLTARLSAVGSFSTSLPASIRLSPSVYGPPFSVRPLSSGDGGISSMNGELRGRLRSRACQTELEDMHGSRPREVTAAEAAIGRPLEVKDVRLGVQVQLRAGTGRKFQAGSKDKLIAWGSKGVIQDNPGCSNPYILWDYGGSVFFPVEDDRGAVLLYLFDQPMREGKAPPEEDGSSPLPWWKSTFRRISFLR